MRAIFMAVWMGVGGAAWAGDAASAADAGGCEAGQHLLTLPDGAALCVSATTVGVSAPGPALPTTVIGPAIGWVDGALVRFVADAHTALPYGHTLGGFVALAPGVDRAGRCDGQALSVRLDGMAVTSASDFRGAPRLPAR